MKKLFTFAAAVLASVAINAEVVYSFTLTESVHTEKDVAYSVDGGTVTFGAAKFETQANTYLYKLDGNPSESNTKYALIETESAIAEGDVITISGYTPSNPKDGQAFVLSDDRAATTKYATLKPDVKGLCSVTYTVESEDPIIGKQSFYISRETSSLHLGGVSIDSSTPSTDPVLAVNPAEVTFAITAAKTEDEATVKFTGKNLAAGSYNLTIPNLAGLTVNPTSVTVGEDGKLNQEVTIAYTSAVDVEAASTSISLTIGGLSKSVAINYSASLAKVYATSLNIEQLVLDNGKSANITAALEAANLEFANIDALDTLNDDPSKTARNYAFLGLKMKKNVESKMALWLAQGSTLKVRFGNVPADVTVTINGEASTITKENIANIDVTDANVYSYTATEDAYIAFTCNTSKALVYKQIMINEEIAEVVLPAPTPTAISNTNANVKAVKVVRNGQLFIEKNGVVYNVLGSTVR